MCFARQARLNKEISDSKSKRESLCKIRLSLFVRADNGNRTRLSSLGSWCSTNELYPHRRIYSTLNPAKIQVPVYIFLQFLTCKLKFQSWVEFNLSQIRIDPNGI